MLAEKVDKDKLDEVKITEINNLFLLRFNSLYIEGGSRGFLHDFLVRRLLQFLNFEFRKKLEDSCWLMNKFIELS
ncbi:unnamed protein product [Blepharisma stoltei]|uniref:Uncharacterized protein n=1 Tax=Blepharisma stoltei TaxID=1481888 RepID=A0AAU9JME3_9CILI|nr:unnamed protein product [Blepharisma stoltei]